MLNALKTTVATLGGKNGQQSATKQASMQLVGYKWRKHMTLAETLARWPQNGSYVTHAQINLSVLCSLTLRAGPRVAGTPGKLNFWRPYKYNVCLI